MHSSQQTYVEGVEIIQPRLVQRWWPLVREGLDVIVENTSPDWIPEDVYSALRRGESTLWMGYEEAIYIGFAVVSGCENPFTGERTLAIWALYMRESKYLDTLIARVKAQAQVDGFDVIMFHSPRRAWERRLDSLGFRVKELTFTCRLGACNGS